MSKGKGQQVMEHNWFPLEFQSSDGKDALQTAQKAAAIYIMSEIPFCPCHFDMGISYTPIFFSESTMYKITGSRFQ